jgi:hypothetical protein
VSEQPENSRREFLERLKYMLGEKRWVKFVEMVESGELERQRQRFFEMLESEEVEEFLREYDFKKKFPGYSTRN